MKIIEWLRQPETRDITDIDNPATTLLHAKIIKKKPFLKNIYIDFYKQFKKQSLITKKNSLLSLEAAEVLLKR